MFSSLQRFSLWWTTVSVSTVYFIASRKDEELPLPLSSLDLTSFSPSSSAAGISHVLLHGIVLGFPVCMNRDKLMKHWADCHAFPTQSISYLFIHYFFSSDPVWRFCLILLFTYLSVSLPEATVCFWSRRGAAAVLVTKAKTLSALYSTEVCVCDMFAFVWLLRRDILFPKSSLGPDSPCLSLST